MLRTLLHEGLQTLAWCTVEQSAKSYALNASCGGSWTTANGCKERRIGVGSQKKQYKRIWMWRGGWWWASLKARKLPHRNLHCQNFLKQMPTERYKELVHKEVVLVPVLIYRGTPLVSDLKLQITGPWAQAVFHQTSHSADLSPICTEEHYGRPCQKSRQTTSTALLSATEPVTLPQKVTRLLSRNVSLENWGCLFQITSFFFVRLWTASRIYCCHNHPGD